MFTCRVNRSDAATRAQSPQMIVCNLTAAAVCHGGVYADWQCPTAINDLTTYSVPVMEVCRFHSKERDFQDRLSARPEMRHGFNGLASHTTPEPQQLSIYRYHGRCVARSRSTGPAHRQRGQGFQADETGPHTGSVSRHHF